jgi:hypothetical protein
VRATATFGFSPSSGDNHNFTQKEVAAMEQNTIDSFPPEVIEKLGFYVYRLIDPRNGETFYVGKGKGNRVFDHLREALRIDGDEDAEDQKLSRIRDIHNADLEVGHVIHRHGLTDENAQIVEAALMDAYAGLHNIAPGFESGDYGSMHAVEIITAYRAVEAVFQHPALLINVYRSWVNRPLIDATRFAWKISAVNAKKAKFILPTVKGIIKGAFVADKWMQASAANFPEFGMDRPSRMAFVGHDAPEEIKRMYVGKRVPDAFRHQGAANPIRYTWH